MTAPDPQLARVLACAHGLEAAVLFLQPPHVLRRIAGDQGVPPAWILRVLGARLVVQAAPQAMSPTRNLVRLGVLVDLTHAASMLAAARVWPRYRRAAIISAGSASLSALAGALLVRGRR